MSEYLSVRDFSKAAKVSNQYVYKIIDTKLKDYVKKVDNHYVISREALNVLNKEELEEPEQEKQQNQPTIEQPNNIELELIEMLKAEIKKKDDILLGYNEEIKSLREELREAHQQISSQALAIADLGKQANYITAADKTVQLIEGEKKRRFFFNKNKTH